MVRDEKRPAPDNVATVLAIVAERAEDFEIEALDCSVAEDNPGYPADDPVVQVVWNDDVDEIATLWRDWSPTELREVVEARDDLKPYHFPTSRLVPDDEIVDVRPSALLDSPYHHREFDAQEDHQYINSVRQRGYVQSIITVREIDAGLEIVAGHKRRWVAEQAGLETMAALPVDLGDREAAECYAADHLDELSGATLYRTVEALRERWADHLILPEVKVTTEEPVA